MRRCATMLLVSGLLAVAPSTGSAVINDGEPDIPPCPGCVAIPDPDRPAIRADETDPGDGEPDPGPCPGCVA